MLKLALFILPLICQAVFSQGASNVDHIGAFTVKEVALNGNTVYVATVLSSELDPAIGRARMMLFCDGLKPSISVTAWLKPNRGSVFKKGISYSDILFFADSSPPVISKWTVYMYDDEDSIALDLSPSPSNVLKLLPLLESSTKLTIQLQIDNENKKYAGKSVAVVFVTDGYRELVQYLPCLFAKRL